MLSGSIRLGTLMQESMRWPYGKCDRILVPSEATARTLIKGKINPAKIQIWRRGVSTEQFTPDKQSLELRRQWGVHDERPALIYVGRVSKEKGLGELRTPCRSAAQVANRSPIHHRGRRSDASRARRR